MGKKLETQTFEPDLPQICAVRMSHMATNKVKGNFYCTSDFLLFVLVSFMGYSGS